MSDTPNDLKYTESHEWVRRETDGTLTIGITDHAQSLLGDLVFVDLPEPDASFKKGDDIAVVESVKTAADVYAPVDGKVIEINDVLSRSPETINQAPYADGWLFRLQPEDVSQVDQLLDAATYSAKVSEE